MANERKPKTSRKKSPDDKMVMKVHSSPASAKSPKKGSKKQEIPKSPSSEEDELSRSPHLPEEVERESEEEEEADAEDVEDADEVEDEEDADDVEDADDEDADDVEDGEDADDTEVVEDHKNGPTGWLKTDDVELFKNIRKACPKDDSMKYDSRVNHIDWEAIKFKEYSAEDCKNRWIFVLKHLRHYRLLNEVLDDAMMWVDRPWFNFNKGGKNNQKHPEQPKKPLTSYMLFYMEQKNAILEKQPGLGMTELSKVIAKMYHELNDRKKLKYTEMAEKEKETYQLKLKKFLEDHPGYVLPKPKNAAKAVPPRLPTPFKLFCDAMITKYLNEGLSTVEARERCREAYKELNDKKKLKWIYKALEQESRYNEEMEKFQTVFKIENPDMEVPKTKKMSLLTKDELQIKLKNEGKPDKPPNSGYSLFSKKLLSSNSLKKIETKERMTEISRMWKELSEAEKASYSEKAHQMNYAYKMMYAAYLETLTPEQRNAELISSVTKGMKRAVGKKTDETASEKKLKTEPKVEITSSDMSSDDEVGSDEDDFEIPQKPAIQKPNSSLQMFCNTNMTKYSSKHPKLTKQELTRLMAKEFAKLSEDKKKIYGTMAQKSKNELSSTTKPSSSAAASKTKSTKAASKKGATKTVTSVASKSPDRSLNSSSAAANDAKAAKSSKVKPSLNANAKSSASKTSTTKTLGQSKAISYPPWAINLPLYNQDEPPKPPESPAAFYALCQNSKNSALSVAEIDALWKQLPEKQKKKVMEDHKKKESDYCVTFENFVRSLNTDQLKKYRLFINKRDHQQDGNKDEGESSDEEEKVSSNESSDEEQPVEMSSDDD